MKAQLTPEWVYRLGGGPVGTQYFHLPRTAIANYEELCHRAASWPTPKPLAEAIETLWQDHGAPTPEIAQSFLQAARAIDSGKSDPQERADLLREWVHACRPPSKRTRIFEGLELGLCFAVRRTRRSLRRLTKRGPRTEETR